MTRKHQKERATAKKFELQLIDQLAEAAASSRSQFVRRSPKIKLVERLEYTKHMIAYTPDDRRC